MAIDYSKLGAEIAATQKANDDARKAEMQRHLRAAMMSKVPDADRKGFETYLKDPQVGGLENLSENRINILKHQNDASAPTKQHQAKLAIQVLNEAERLYAARVQTDYLTTQNQPIPTQQTATPLPKPETVTLASAAASKPGTEKPAAPAAKPATVTAPPANNTTQVVATFNTEELKQNPLSLNKIVTLTGVVDLTKPTTQPQQVAQAPAASAAAAPLPKREKELFPLTGREQEAFTLALADKAVKLQIKPEYITRFINEIPLRALDQKIDALTEKRNNPKADKERPKDPSVASLYAQDLKNAAAILAETKKQVKVLEAKQKQEIQRKLATVQENERATHEKAKEDAIMLERNAHPQVTAAADKAAAQERTLAEARAKQAEQGKKAAHLDSLRAEEAELRAQAAAKRHAANTAAEDAQKLAKAREIDATNHALFAKADITAQERNARPNVYAALAAREIDARNAAAAKKAADPAPAPATTAVAQVPTAPEKATSKLTDPRLINALDQTKLDPKQKEAVTSLLVKLSDPDLDKMQKALETHQKSLGKTNQGPVRANNEAALKVIKTAEVTAALAIAPAPTAANTAADTQRLAATKEAAERAAAEAAKAKAETAAREALAIPATKPAPATGKTIYTSQKGEGWTNIATADLEAIDALRKKTKAAIIAAYKKDPTDKKETAVSPSPRVVTEVLAAVLAHEEKATHIHKLKEGTKIHDVSDAVIAKSVATLQKNGRLDEKANINLGALPYELEKIFAEGPAKTGAVAKPTPDIKK